MKVAPQALPISLSVWERAGVTETSMVPTTYLFWGGAGAMTVGRAALPARAAVFST